MYEMSGNHKSLVTRLTRFSGKHTSLIFFLTCYLLVLMRNLEPFRYPQLYAEDGLYLGEILKGSLFSFAWSERPGYAILGHVLVLKIAWYVNNNLFGYDLTYISQIVALISNLLFTLVGFLLYRVVKIFDKNMGIILGLLLPLISMGNNANATFGRMLNFEFLWPVVTAAGMSIVIRTAISSPQDKDKRRNFFVLSLFSCVFTLACLSLVFAIVPIVIGLAVFTVYRPKKFQLLKVIFVCTPSTITSAVIWFTHVATPDPLAGKLPLSDYLLFATRGFIWPFISGFYTHMNIFLSSIILLLILIFMLFNKDIFKKSDFEIWIFLGSAFGYFMAFSLLRSSIVVSLRGFESSWPDHYFFGFNLLSASFFILVLVKYREAKNNKTKNNKTKNNKTKNNKTKNNKTKNNKTKNNKTKVNLTVLLSLVLYLPGIIEIVTQLNMPANSFREWPKLQDAFQSDVCIDNSSKVTIPPFIDHAPWSLDISSNFTKFKASNCDG